MTGLWHRPIADFPAGAGIGNRINVDSVFANFATVRSAAAESGDTTTIIVNATKKIYLNGITIAQLNVDDFVF